MLIVRSWPVLGDMLERRKAPRVGVKQLVEILGLDWHDAPVVSRCFDLRRWLVPDRREGLQASLTRSRPKRPQTGN